MSHSTQNITKRKRPHSAVNDGNVPSQNSECRESNDDSRHSKIIRVKPARPSGSSHQSQNKRPVVELFDHTSKRLPVIQQVNENEGVIVGSSYTFMGSTNRFTNGKYHSNPEIEGSPATSLIETQESFEGEITKETHIEKSPSQNDSTENVLTSNVTRWTLEIKLRKITKSVETLQPATESVTVVKELSDSEITVNEQDGFSLDVDDNNSISINVSTQNDNSFSGGFMLFDQMIEDFELDPKKLSSLSLGPSGTKNGDKSEGQTKSPNQPHDLSKNHGEQRSKIDTPNSTGKSKIRADKSLMPRPSPPPPTQEPIHTDELLSSTASQSSTNKPTNTNVLSHSGENPMRIDALLSMPQRRNNVREETGDDQSPSVEPSNASSDQNLRNRLKSKDALNRHQSDRHGDCLPCQKEQPQHCISSNSFESCATERSTGQSQLQNNSKDSNSSPLQKSKHRKGRIHTTSSQRSPAPAPQTHNVHESETRQKANTSAMIEIPSRSPSPKQHSIGISSQSPLPEHPIESRQTSNTPIAPSLSPSPPPLPILVTDNPNTEQILNGEESTNASGTISTQVLSSAPSQDPQRYQRREENVGASDIIYQPIEIPSSPPPLTTNESTDLIPGAPYFMTPNQASIIQQRNQVDTQIPPIFRNPDHEPLLQEFLNYLYARKMAGACFVDIALEIDTLSEHTSTIDYNTVWKIYEDRAFPDHDEKIIIAIKTWCSIEKAKSTRGPAKTGPHAESNDNENEDQDQDEYMIEFSQTPSREKPAPEFRLIQPEDHAFLDEFLRYLQPQLAQGTSIEQVALQIHEFTGYNSQITIGTIMKMMSRSAMPADICTVLGINKWIAWCRTEENRNRTQITRKP